MVDGIALSDIGSPASFATFTLLAIWVLRTWPHWKSKINEARKIERDADSVLRTDLLKRIRDLEEGQSADRREFNAALSDERKRCDAELDEIRARLTLAETENRSLQAMIRQNSQSSAQMLGRPGDVAESIARREKNGD